MAPPLATARQVARQPPPTGSCEKSGLDETHQFDFGAIASGAYALSVPSGWRASLGDGDTAAANYPKGATAKVGNALNPLGSDVALDVTPATGLVYGRVTDGDGFAMDSVTVTANGVSTMTDADGRYIIDGISSATRTISKVKQSDKIFVETAEGGLVKPYLEFAANKPQPQDISLSGAALTASVSGTVRASGSNAPVAGVEITVDGEAPQNAAKSGTNKGKLVTGADGTYTATFEAKDIGATVNVSASKAGMTFVPGELAAPAHSGSEISGLDFVGFVNATISGRVRGPDGRAMSGVTVTATAAGDAADTVAMATTRSTGTFSLNVPFGSYVLAVSTAEAGVSFEIPAVYRLLVNVAPGQSVNIGTIDAMSPTARNVKAARVLPPDDTNTADVDESQTYADNIEVSWTADAEAVPDGYAPAQYTYETSVNDGEDWGTANFTSTDVDATDDEEVGTISIPADSDGGFMFRVVAAAGVDNTIVGLEPLAGLNSKPATVAAIDPSARGVTARRAVEAEANDTLVVEWKATTNANSDFQVVVRVNAAEVDADVWFVREVTGAARSWGLDYDDEYTGEWTSVGGATITVIAADLDKALMVAVESVQGTFDAEDNPWVRSAVRPIAAKPSS